MRHVSDNERRARLGARHALASPVSSAEDVVAAMTALHATEPPTVYLSYWARASSPSIADLDRALFSDRTVVKQLAMRRTLFVFPRDLLPAVWPSASARVAEFERARMTRDTVQTGLGAEWLDRARTSVLDALASAPDGLAGAEIRQAVPLIDVKVAPTRGEVWSAHRVLTHLSLTADIVRGVNTGGWHVSRPRWTQMRNWLGQAPAPLDSDRGYQEIIRRWLFTFGPGTEDDLVWWLGATKGAVRSALAALGAVAVSLDRGEVGWLLPTDVEEVASPEPWVALLPVLDPTVMGWKGRAFYLGPHRDLIFDQRGNAGTTAWVDGRIVGCWVQDPAGTVRVKLLEDLPAGARQALADEAARLTSWLGGFRISPVYTSPAMASA